MSDNLRISTEIIDAKQRELENDPMVKEMVGIQEQIKEKEKELAYLKAELSIIKNNRAESITIRWRESILWCLTVDSKNPYYFLKSSIGVHKCIAFKHSLDITADIKNKIATTLSTMFRENKLVGRIEHNGTFYYGIKELFEDDFITLKKEYRGKLKDLKEVNI